MNYEEAIEYIHGIYWRGSKLGLSRTKELLELLGNPQKDLKFVHVAGTNGKGSTCAMLSSVFMRCGYRTGLYISPYIRRFNERIQFDGEPITDAELAEVTTHVSASAGSHEGQANGIRAGNGNRNGIFQTETLRDRHIGNGPWRHSGFYKYH